MRRVSGGVARQKWRQRSDKPSPSLECLGGLRRPGVLDKAVPQVEVEDRGREFADGDELPGLVANVGVL